jgi:hypothetical protein
MTHEELVAHTLKLTQAIIKLQDQIIELKKQLPMQITDECPFDPDPEKPVKQTIEYTTDGAPTWEIWFKVNTSEGITERIVEANAWTEKQAIFLGRTEKLFPMMSELVKTKQMQPKWNILDAVATKK